MSVHGYWLRSVSWAADPVRRRLPLASAVRACHQARWHRASSGGILAGHAKRPQQDSNLRSRLRRPPLRSSEFVLSTCMDSIAYPGDGHDYSAYIPDHEDGPVTARTLQGMARVRSGQAPAWPLSSDRSARRGSRVKHDLACTFTWHFFLCSLPCGHSHA